MIRQTLVNRQTLENRQTLVIRQIIVMSLIGGLSLSVGSVMAADTEVEIVRPFLGLPLFDQVVLEAKVVSELPVVRVEFLIDGALMGSVEEPPYRLAVDVGEENRDRQIEAVAYGEHGAMGRASRLAEAVRIDDVVSLDLQQLYVTVSDRRGNRVHDLKARDFEIRDEKKQQEVITFANGNVPFTAVLLIDGSFSMANGPLDAALTGARHFVRDMAHHDRAKVLVYSDHVVRATPWTSHASVLTEALKETEAKGGSSVVDHLFLTLELLEAEQGRRVVILLSDGWDLHSVLDADQVRDIARRSQAAIYWVRLGLAKGPKATSGRRSDFRSQGRLESPRRMLIDRISLSTWRDSDASREIFQQLAAMVDDSGGRIIDVEHLSAIEAAFSDILQELREQVALGYYPTPRRQDGSWRRVKVKLQRQSLSLRTRKGYIDRKKTQ